MKTMILAILSLAFCAANAATIVPPQQGGTGISNASTQTTTRSGAFGLTQTLTGTTNVTYPTSGTLATTAGTVTTATNLAGGAANNVPYQSGAGTTAFFTGITVSGGALATVAASGTVTSAILLGGALFASGAIVPSDKAYYFNSTNTLASGSAQANINALNSTTLRVGATGNLDALGSLNLLNLTTTATSSTGTAAIIDGSNVLRPLTSSRRFKNVTDEHWTPSDDMVRNFLATPAIKWDYRENGARDVVGFGAEDLSVVGRELVNYDAEGKPYSNRDHAIMAMMKEIIKRQQEQIDGIESKLEKQSQEIASLRSAGGRYIEYDPRQTTCYTTGWNTECHPLPILKISTTLH